MGQVRKVPDNLAWRAGAEVYAVNGGETKLVIPETAYAHGSGSINML